MLNRKELQIDVGGLGSNPGSDTTYIVLRNQEHFPGQNVVICKQELNTVIEFFKE